MVNYVDTSTYDVWLWERSRGYILSDDVPPPEIEGGLLGNWSSRGFVEGLLISG